MKFDYGKTGIEVDIEPSWNVTILRPVKQKILNRPVEGIRRALRDPIGTLPLDQIIEGKEKLEKVVSTNEEAVQELLRSYDTANKEPLWINLVLSFVVGSLSSLFVVFLVGFLKRKKLIDVR